MDTKSLAKSKRAHSQHLSKKHHPNPTQKGPSNSSIGASSSKKPQGKEIKGKPRPPPSSSALPSNWDRYEEEFDLGTEDPSQDCNNQPTDVILPKSKGADYSYLISEAESQNQTSCSAGIFPSFDDVVQDFYQGIGSFISVRGQSISLIEGDSFIVEDKAATSNEASFLSLDLHALAEQLGKVDLSKRLFIEADLVPLDLFPEELHATHSSHQNQADNESKMSKKDSDKLPADRTPEATVNNHPVQGFGKDQLKPIDQVKEEPGRFIRPGQRSELESSVELNVSQDQKKKLSEFEAAAAEAELDVLLGSFSQTNLVDSLGIREKSTTCMSQRERTILPPSWNHLPAKKGSDLSKPSLSADLDDTLDDLLKETSSLVSQSAASLSHEVKASPSGSLSSPSSGLASKAKVLDDFDSWLDTI